MLRSPDTFNPQIRLPSAQSTSDQAERWETRSVRFCWFLARVRLVRFTEWPSYVFLQKEGNYEYKLTLFYARYTLSMWLPTPFAYVKLTLRNCYVNSESNVTALRTSGGRCDVNQVPVWMELQWQSRCCMPHLFNCFLMQVLNQSSPWHQLNAFRSVGMAKTTARLV